MVTVRPELILNPPFGPMRTVVVAGKVKFPELIRHLLFCGKSKNALVAPTVEILAWTAAVESVAPSHGTVTLRVVVPSDWHHAGTVTSRVSRASLIMALLYDGLVKNGVAVAGWIRNRSNSSTDCETCS